MRKKANEKVTLGMILSVINANQEICLVDREGQRLTGIETVSFIRKTEKFLSSRYVIDVQVAPGDTYLTIMLP